MGIKYRINDVRAERVIIPAAQILAMSATPFTVVKAPGANKVLLVDNMLLQIVPGTVAFAAGGVVNIQYHGTSIVVHAASIPASYLTSNTPSNNFLTEPGAVVQAPANTGLDITNAAGAFTTGNGTMLLTVWYKVLTLG